MTDIQSIVVSDKFGLSSLVIDFTLKDTKEDLANYRFDLYKAFHQTQNYFLIKSDVTNFSYRDVNINLYNVSINYYYKVLVTDRTTGESKMSDIYGEYKWAKPDLHALAIIDIHEAYLKNVVGNTMILLKKKRIGQICTCFDDVRRRSNPVSCNLCYGTKYLGGYYSPYTIPVNFLNPPTTIEYFAPNDVGEWEGTPLQLWTQNYPLIQVQDIIVNSHENIRYVVTNTHPSLMNFYLIRQTIQMQRLPDSNIVYQFSIE